MIDDVVYVARIEILKDGNNNGPISNCGHVSNAPTGIVFSDNRNFVTTSQATMFEQQVKAGYLFGNLPIGITDVVTIIGITR